MRKVTDLLEIQQMAQVLLARFGNYCDEFHLSYSLAYGSLIGAVRHHGFIPWDDDIDLWMLRDDYDRLCNTFPQWGKKHGMYINCATQTKGYNRTHAQICLSNTKLEMHGRRNVYPEGYFIDVFPLDGIPAQKIKQWLRLNHLQFLKNLGTISAYNDEGKGAKGILLSVLSHLAKGSDAQKAMLRYETVARKTAVCSGGFIQFPYIKTGGRNMVLPADSFLRTESVPFEEEQRPIPAGYDVILRRIYGNYMQLPPEESQKPHHNFDLYVIEEE